jgi:hypothetical protein
MINPSQTLRIKRSPANLKQLALIKLRADKPTKKQMNNKIVQAASKNIMARVTKKISCI